MKLFKSYFFVLFLVLLGSTNTWSQKKTGSVKGVVSTASTNQAVIGATVYVEGTSPVRGTSTNVEGEFIVNDIPEGKYALVVSMIGYKTTRWEGINITSGRVSTLFILMEEQNADELEAVQLTIQRATSSEVSVIREIKEAQVVSTGISAEQISRGLDTDAGQALRRLPGVSLIDNRFIMVRGLGERYNNVLLNGALAPNTEVDTRSFSFDLIPSSAIDRMLIVKTGSADLPGDFAGAIIKVYTKNVPSRNFLNVSAQLGYRLGTTGNTLLDYQGSPTDWLGFDNGTRKLPENFPSEKILIDNRDGLSENQVVEATKSLSNIWQTTPYTAPPDFKGALDLGRRFDWKGVRIGNLTTLTYQRNRQFAVIEQNRFNIYNAEKREKGDFSNYTNEQSSVSTRFGALHNWSLIFDQNHKVEFRNLFNQLSLDRATLREGFNSNISGNQLRAYELFYESRSIYSGQLSGEHTLPTTTKINWLIGHNYIKRLQPDLRRYYGVRDTSGVFRLQSFSQANLTNNSRFFSTLSEKAYMAGMDIEHGFKISQEDKLTLKAGGFYEKKDRDFSARWMSLTFSDSFNSSGAYPTAPL